MSCLSWLLMSATASAYLPGFASVCLDRSRCDELDNKGQVQDCVLRCISAIQPGGPELGPLALEVIDGDADLQLSIILAALVSENKIPESDPRGRGRGAARRSYSMEHFRWGKPSGRKRRPAKAFASSREGGGSSERGLPAPARRQLGLHGYRVRDLKEGGRSQGSQRIDLKAQAPVRKDGAYRMSHFRWGSPPPSKRNGGTIKRPMRKPKVPLDKLLRNTVIKEQRRLG